MAFTIKDGASGNVGKVDANNRFHTSGVEITEEGQANRKGNAYNINTGVITLTDAADTPILYVKNNDDLDLHISAIAVGVGPTTGGSGGIPKITVVRNPTTGTIISTTPTDVDIKSNRNYGASGVATNVVAYKGATGDTTTDGDDHIIFFQTSSGRLFATIEEILPKGSSIGVKFDPQASNTSQDVYCALICHFADKENDD